MGIFFRNVNSIWVIIYEYLCVFSQYFWFCFFLMKSTTFIKWNWKQYVMQWLDWATLEYPQVNFIRTLLGVQSIFVCLLIEKQIAFIRTFRRMWDSEWIRLLTTMLMSGECELLGGTHARTSCECTVGKGPPRVRNTQSATYPVMCVGWNDVLKTYEWKLEFIFSGFFVCLFWVMWFSHCSCATIIPRSSIFNSDVNGYLIEEEEEKKQVMSTKCYRSLNGSIEWDLDSDRNNLNAVYDLVIAVADWNAAVIFEKRRAYDINIISSWMIYDWWHPIQ